jgi:hypothetical protein
MRNHIWRLITGAVVSMVSLSVIQYSLELCSVDVWRRTAFFTLLALWAIATGTGLGALIYYDLRSSLQEPGLPASERGRNV